MSIRATISGLLAGDHLLSDPATALEEAGYDDISAEAFGTALGHFSDTATLEEADALAPVVTRTGPIPFDESDLPEIDIEIESNDAFSLFARTATTVHQDFGETDLDDLTDLDHTSALDPSADDDASLDNADETDFDFGKPSSQPSSQPTAQDSPSDEFAGDRSAELPEPALSTAEDDLPQPTEFGVQPETTDTPESGFDDDPDDPFDDDLGFDT